jgi:phenylalanyl-tRNA synthetase beta chain
MDIKISDNWLRDYLKTKATPKQIEEKLSLCGPSIEKITKTKNGDIYSIEITTNRIDMTGVYGIAREAAAILPTFGLKAKLYPLKVKSKQTLASQVNYLEVIVDKNLCPRFAAVLIKNCKIADSPLWIQKRLEAIGVRPINNIVDISNYIMHELGQPVHTFDYDKIGGAKMILRKSKKGESVTTLDEKNHMLTDNDIVIEDGNHRLIDLCGIMGGENSAIDEKTKNVLLFVQTYNPVNIRRTSMRLAQRTEAAEIFEKGIDPELVETGIRRGIDLFIEITGGKPANKILDIYPDPSKEKVIEIDKDFLDLRLGIELGKNQISKILESLDFSSNWKGNILFVKVPSWRIKDVEIREDILEEVARIYGYHNLNSELMAGVLPDKLYNAPFDFEDKLKRTLKGYGGTEIYTLSLVPESFADKNALKLKNPLGPEASYLRTSLMPSLLKAAKENIGIEDSFHLFEISNVYLPKIGNLPEEKMMLAGILSKINYREAKGIIEALLEEINIEADFITEDEINFLPSQRLIIKKNNQYLGQLGKTEKDLVYYEFEVESLRKNVSPQKYQEIPKFPPQIEDVTLELPDKTKKGEVLKTIKSSGYLINKAELTDIYKNAYTFRIWYQHPSKTLNDKEVEEIRNKILQSIKTKYGGALMV